MGSCEGSPTSERHMQPHDSKLEPQFGRKCLIAGCFIIMRARTKVLGHLAFDQPSDSFVDVDDVDNIRTPETSKACNGAEVVVCTNPSHGACPDTWRLLRCSRHGASITRSLRSPVRCSWQPSIVGPLASQQARFSAMQSVSLSAILVV